jgi:phosphoribosylanthranilate isomerase
MVKVKICGITNIEDAMAAVEAGADALGFVFAESPRHVDPETAAGIRGKLPPFISTVGVFANQETEEIVSVMWSTGLDFAQIHGEVLGIRGEKDLIHRGTSPGIGLTVHAAATLRGMIRGVRVGCREDLAAAQRDRLAEICDALLLDAHIEGKMGGTGQTFDWDLAIEARSLGMPIILAGGLNPENVEEAVRKVRPYAVDVSSGVEALPGRKDHQKMKEFIRNAKRAD